MKCPWCQHDNPADAAFCHVCGARRQPACPRCGEPARADANFCATCGQPLGEAPADWPAAFRQLGPQLYTPSHLAEKILTSKVSLEGERKQVTVLFADLKDSMELLADRDPEEARELLDPLLHLMMEAVHRYEGTVNQVMGDGIMAIFGAPLAHEDHAVRACYAALRMQDSVRRYSEERQQAAVGPVAIRVGLNSGDVVVRSIGSDLRMDYTAVGQTTHLAARMEQAALPGSILLTAHTVRLAEGFVKTRALGPIAVKGLAEPVAAFELSGAGAARTRLQVAVARGLTGFVGRQTELEAFRQALEKARDGRGQIVALVGEAGVGKSRLVWELTHSERTQGWLELEATATSYGQATPFFGVAELLRGYFKLESQDDAARIQQKVTDRLGSDDALGEEVVPILGLLEALPHAHAFHALDPPERRRRILLAVEQVLLRESTVQPLLLIFEDLQWADSETLRSLDAVVNILPQARLCLVLTYRTGYEHRWTGKSTYTQLVIDPLPAENVNAMLQTLLGNDASLAPLRQLLVERTEGNPFFVEESVRMLADTGVVTGTWGSYALTGDMPAVHVPGTVQAVLASRIDRLPPEEKRLLQSAAVVGRDAPLGLLRAVTDLPPDELRASLSHLQAAEFLYESRLFPELEYAFRHGLTQEVAYRSLLLERRKELHARALEAMEQLWESHGADQVDALARHALGGEVWDKAIDYLREAGSRAYRRGALRKALDRYEQALELLPRLPTNDDNLRRRIDVRIDIHPPLFNFGQIPRLTQLHEEAARFAHQLGDEPRLGQVLSRLGLYSFADANYAQGIDYAQQALAIAERTADQELGIITLYLLGINHAALGRVTQSVEFLSRIADGPDAELSKRVIGLSAAPYVLACAWLAAAFGWSGDLSRSEAYAERAVRAADESDHPYAQAIAHTWRVLPIAYRGDFADAIPLAEFAVRLCEKKELLGWLPFAYSVWGWILSWAGRPAEGVPFIERAVTLLETVGIKAFLALRYVEWAEGLLLDHSLDDARRRAMRAVDLAVAHGERASETWARCLMGDIALASSAADVEVARAHYEQSRALAEELGLPLLRARCHLGLGRVELLGPHRARAREHLTAAGRLGREAGSPYWSARVDEVAATLSER